MTHLSASDSFRPWHYINLLTYLRSGTSAYFIRSVNQQLLEKHRVFIAFGKRYFSYLAPKTWNTLTIEIRLFLTLETFKRRLKTHPLG